MNWFKICMEVPDDGAGGGGDEEAEANEFVSVFSQRGWTGDTPEATEAPPEEEAPEGEEEPQQEEEDAAVAQPAGWSDADWSAFQRQFPGGSEADLWKHYSNLRAAFSRGERGDPDPQPEPEQQAPLAPTWTADQFSALGEIPSDGLSSLQRQQLGELMQLDPKAAATWAAANSHLLTEEEFGAVQGNWYQADPWGARQAWNAAEEAQRQERMQEEFGPRMAAVDEAQALSGMSLALQAVPQMAAHRQEFAEWIEANPQVDEHLTSLTDPMEIRNSLVTIFYNWYGPRAIEQLTATEAAAAEAAQAEAEAEAQAAQDALKQTKRARTLTSSAPATPAGSEVATDDIRAAIRGAARGTVPSRG